jgi:hypothetical protein
VRRRPATAGHDAIELARLRASRAKRALAAASEAGFLVTMGLARAAHPGHSTTSAAVTSSASASSNPAPVVQTHVS